MHYFMLKTIDFCQWVWYINIQGKGNDQEVSERKAYRVSRIPRTAGFGK